MYISLARKYRPKTFADVAVQSHVSNTLKGAIARGRVAHGYLLCGPRGVGKTTLARVLAMALNCERREAGSGNREAGSHAAEAESSEAKGPTVVESVKTALGIEREGVPRPASRVPHSAPGEPCGECTSCQRIWSGSASLDVVEIDAASNRGVDDARELRERAMYAPSTDAHYKVYIVDEAHMLTREAWNALLKVLEEPPPRVVFVFATTEPQKIAQAAAPVLSRLQRFDFKRIGFADVRARLTAVLHAEGVAAEADALALLARAADGSMRDALSLADQALSLGEGTLSAERVREALGLVAEDEYLAVLDIVAERRAGEVFPAIARLVDAGVDLGTFLTGLADILRAQLALALGGTAGDLSERSRDALMERRDRLSPGDLLRMLNAVVELEPRFRRSGQQRVLLETLLVRFALMDRTVSLEDVLRGLGGAEEGGEGAPRSPRPAAPPPVRRESGRPGPSASTASAASDAGVPSPVPAPPASPPREPSSAAAPDGGAPRAGREASAGPSPEAARGARRAGVSPLELNALAERWGDVVERVRASGRGVLAAALDHAMPVAVSARGEVVLELDPPNDLYEQAIASAAADVLSAIGELFTGATRLRARGGASAPADDDAPRRLTEDAVRSQRLELLVRRDPALQAAVDALDLELLD